MTATESTGRWNLAVRSTGFARFARIDARRYGVPAVTAASKVSTSPAAIS